MSRGCAVNGVGEAQGQRACPTSALKTRLLGASGVFRGFNPQSSIYQWSTELLADGEDPVRYLGPTLRLNVYQQDPYR